MPFGLVGPGNYPSLNEVANLVRALVNDDKKGATGTPGEGQILTNTSTTLTHLLNSAIRETYREVRISGQPTLIKDNYILLGLPPVNSPLGVGVINPAIQTSLQFVGFFDGLQFNADFSLPSDLIFPLEVWERQSGTNHDFRPMHESSGPLRSRRQVQHIGEWEWRADAIWMPGSIEPRDIRIRYISTFVSVAAVGIDFKNTFIPILDSAEAVADKIVLRYGRRNASTESQALIPDLITQANTSMTRLRQQVTRSRQRIDYQVKKFSGGSGTSNARSQYLF
jgi:hypothetical protein